MSSDDPPERKRAPVTQLHPLDPEFERAALLADLEDLRAEIDAEPLENVPVLDDVVAPRKRTAASDLATTPSAPPAPEPVIREDWRTAADRIVAESRDQLRRLRDGNHAPSSVDGDLANALNAQLERMLDEELAAMRATILERFQAELQPLIDRYLEDPDDRP